MRLFFALVPDEALRSALGGLARALAGRFGGRAVPAHNVHLTLAFLGEVDSARVPVLCTILEAMPRDAFVMTLDRVGEWHHAGVVWIAPSVVPAEIVTLHATLSEALRIAEFPVEARPFRPHLTLVRRRKSTLADAPASPLAWRVQRLSLMRSETAGGAARYREEGGIALTHST